jgi:hypothetical protein
MQITEKEIAGVLRSTDEMAAKFAERVQERVGQPISYAEILAVMEAMSPSRLTMDKVVYKIQRQLNV